MESKCRAQMKTKQKKKNKWNEIEVSYKWEKGGEGETVKWNESEEMYFLVS